MEKPADTTYPLLDIIKRRWSPRAFDSRLVEREKLLTLFEAMRWSESCNNEQPWRLIVAERENTAEFEKALGCLAEKNQQWVKFAPVLILTVAKKTFTHNGKPIRTHLYDLGLGMQSLVFQAMALGLFSHQMAGVDLDKVRESYHIPDDFEPVTAMALGYPFDGDPVHLPEWAREGENTVRSRKALDEILIGDDWGKVSPIV